LHNTGASNTVLKYVDNLINIRAEEHVSVHIDDGKVIASCVQSRRFHAGM
jgi:hypothetical protein